MPSQAFALVASPRLGLQQLINVVNNVIIQLDAKFKKLLKICS
jgi:hypothetical protein